MIKSFNPSIAGLNLTKARSFIRTSFLTGRPKWIGSLVTGFVIVGALLFMLSPAAADSDRHDDRRTLRWQIAFTSFHSTQAGAVPAVGDQFTYGGTLARTKKPDQLIGTFGAHFVATAPGGAELLGNGSLILPDGKISFQMFLGAKDFEADGRGVINRYGAITGGTGDYRNAGGEIIHQTRANGEHEFILTFSN